jgi:hypothetical protein
MPNKAHTATARRIAARWGGAIRSDGAPDIVLPDGAIEVETSATLEEGLEKLLRCNGYRYLAVTNKETVPAALERANGTGIGVLDSHGAVLLEASATNSDVA